MIKNDPQTLRKFEQLFKENDYQIRYDKGNFKSGYCILEQKKVVVINKFATTESRINALTEIVRRLVEEKNFKTDTDQKLIEDIELG